ncbi:hypothetical protein [Pedobacter frigoris]|uniref:Uncharacterized protein n=1 Tax=Pedobacter frigoris TaxID=2571272 RepID=A0A4U1CM23_9SPHI|nr:hypothetical protein [Pedobacter frigoris]TKC08891.1 hypothetical protein FA047_01990 [Pedobacter frigoris]
MSKKKVKREASLSLNIYKKPDNKASLVFRNKAMLFRITTIERAKEFVQTVNEYLNDLRKDCADPCFVFQFQSPRNRSWVLEIGMKEPGAMELNLWLDEGIKSMKRCFKWIGDVTDLTRLSLPF